MSERRRRMALSAALHVVSHALAIVYCLVTLGEPHRSLMLTAFGCGMAAGILGLWAARTVTTKAVGYRVSFSILLVTLVVVALGAYWDGGAASPASLGFVSTAVFVASYTPPLRLMIAFEALILGSYLAVAAAGQPPRPGHVFLYVGGILLLTSVCAAQARIVARQRTQLRSLASLDPLTGALNRRGLADFAGPLFRGCRPPELSLLCLDLDDFKLVNDRLGHAAGDALLQRTVAAVREVLRADDAVARIGGDEFVVVLVDAPEPTARSIALRIDETVRELTGVSIGWATAPHDGVTLEALLRVADQRLYRVKQERRRAGGASSCVGHAVTTGRPDPF
ncbi:GGDEF domain-containing protein [Micromonospora sp. R77]|uniref:GGDEF domain-containing protein n=1 Tax=Micromonospora sp. R77 TaxID=2925836 RepID=UPI001F619CE9|nr:GGDEF domain-containing protein [Micromonospora sp. R77]MCI4066875.1 GGDEF domain-containing protein [Micromonospora sp. R77]